LEVVKLVETLDVLDVVVSLFLILFSYLLRLLHYFL
jgi:hypothetical protein